MKKLLSLFLVFCMIFSLAACSSGLSAEEGSADTQINPETTQNETTAESKEETVDDSPIVYPEGFSVGFGRVNISPPTGTGLGGYGNATERTSREILDDLFLTCTAICDGENVLLFFAADLEGLGATNVNTALKQLNKAYGIPTDHVFFNITHSHSSPGLQTTNFANGVKYCQQFYKASVEAAGIALRDLENATVSYGTANTEGLNYVRRYVSLVDGSPVSKNVSAGQDPTKVAHESEPDTQFQIIKFDRAEKKDIVLGNWQCHPTGPGGDKDYRVSADYVGVLRNAVESEAGVLFAFFQGAGGNLAQGGKIKGDNNFGGDNYIKHGQLIAKTALAAMENTTPVATGPLQAKRFQIEAEYGEAIQKGEKKATYSSKIPLSVFSIGDAAFAICPGEPCDQLGTGVKQNSPFRYTFFCGYSNGANGYIPAAVSYPNMGYEVGATQYAAGTGEAIVSALLNELNAIYPTRF